jgi:hypothetical protein
VGGWIGEDCPLRDAAQIHIAAKSMRLSLQIVERRQRATFAKNPEAARGFIESQYICVASASIRNFHARGRSRGGFSFLCVVQIDGRPGRYDTGQPPHK